MTVDTAIQPLALFGIASTSPFICAFIRAFSHVRIFYMQISLDVTETTYDLLAFAHISFYRIRSALSPHLYSRWALRCHPAQQWRRKSIGVRTVKNPPPPPPPPSPLAPRTAEYRETFQRSARSLCGVHGEASLTTPLNETLRPASALQEMQKSEHHHQSRHGKSRAGARRVRRNIWRPIRLPVTKMADADHGSIASCSLSAPP